MLVYDNRRKIYVNYFKKDAPEVSKGWEMSIKTLRSAEHNQMRQSRHQYSSHEGFDDRIELQTRMALEQLIYR
jgi:hypothetical protein